MYQTAVSSPNLKARCTQSTYTPPTYLPAWTCWFPRGCVQTPSYQLLSLFSIDLYLYVLYMSYSYTDRNRMCPQGGERRRGRSALQNPNMSCDISAKNSLRQWKDASAFSYMAHKNALWSVNHSLFACVCTSQQHK